MKKQKEIVICDVCEEEINEEMYKCALCGKDLCSGCSFDGNDDEDKQACKILLEMGGRNVGDMYYLCKKCDKKIVKLMQEYVEAIKADKQLRQKLIDTFKQTIILDAL